MAKPKIKKKKRKKINTSSTVKCKGCGMWIAKPNIYCGECLCEDDCGY